MTRTVKDVVVGDVWVLTGSTRVSGELISAAADADTFEPIPLLREFRIRTKARRFREPRKRQMEIGGGKYRSLWVPATPVNGKLDTCVASHSFATRVAEPGIPIGVITLGADNPPITWVSYEGLQRAVGFEKERDELNLLYPNTPFGKSAVTDYIKTLRLYNSTVAARLLEGDELPDELALEAPAFPQPRRNQWAKHTENATLTYNFCISPLTPLAVRGVVWIPGQHNIGADVARYGPALTAYGASLPRTYGQKEVRFVYGQPSAALVPGLSNPGIPNSECLEFDSWPRSLRSIAGQLGRLAAEQK